MASMMTAAKAPSRSLPRAAERMADDSRAPLAAQEPQNEGQHDRDHEAGDEREVEPAALGLDADVARQAPQAELRKPGPGEARRDQGEPEDNQGALHTAWTGARAVRSSAVLGLQSADLDAPGTEIRRRHHLPRVRRQRRARARAPARHRLDLRGL